MCRCSCTPKGGWLLLALAFGFQGQTLGSPMYPSMTAMFHAAGSETAGSETVQARGERTCSAALACLQ